MAVLYFDGNTSVDLGTVEDFQILNESFTLDFWFKSDPKGDDPLPIIGMELETQFGQHNFYVILSDGEMMTGVDKDELLPINPNSSRIPSHTWVHGAVQYIKRSKSIWIYLNGYSITRKLDFELKQEVGRIVLGSGLIGSKEHFFRGWIGEVRIWKGTKHVFGPTMYQALKGDEKDLMGYFPLDRKTEVLINASRINSTPEVALQNPKWEEEDDFPISATETDVAAVHFQGKARQDIRISRSTKFDTTEQITIEAWINFDEEAKDDEQRVIVATNNALPNQGWELWVSRKKVSFKIAINNKLEEVTRDTFMLANHWNHVVGVYDGTRIMTYLNGIEWHQVSKPGKITPFPGSIAIGSKDRKAKSAFMGQIAEVRIWDKAIPSSTIKQLLYQTLDQSKLSQLKAIDGDTLTQNNLLGYWKLDATYNEVAIDSSIHDHEGRLVNVNINETRLPVVNRLSFDPNDRDKNIRKLWGRRNDFLQEIEDLENKIGTLSNRLETQKVEVDKEKKRREEAEAIAADLNTQIAALNQEIIDLKGKVTADAEKGNSLQVLIENAHEQIRTAREKLQGSDYKLGNVNLELNVIPAGPGAFHFPSKDDLIQIVGDNKLSKLELEFATKDTGQGVVSDEKEVPNVSGLTEVMAHRKLDNAGFLIEVKFMAVSKERAPEHIDRVVRQRPIAGTKAKINTPVLVFIGKES